MTETDESLVDRELHEALRPDKTYAHVSLHRVAVSVPTQCNSAEFLFKTKVPSEPSSHNVSSKFRNSRPFNEVNSQKDTHNAPLKISSRSKAAWKNKQVTQKTSSHNHSAQSVFE